MDNYQNVSLYLDHDFVGEKCTQQALSRNTKYKDESKLYEVHKDLNEWVQAIGKGQKRSVRQRLK